VCQSGLQLIEKKPRPKSSLTSFLVNTVVAGKLQYTMQTTGLPRSFLHRVDNKSTRIIKRSLKVGLSGPRHVVFCKKYGVGVVNMTELQDAITVSEEIVRLNSKGLAGEVARARLMVTKGRLGVLSSPLDNDGMCEAKVKRFGSNMTQYVQQSLRQKGCT
jgi:hypothetical protein